MTARAWRQRGSASPPFPFPPPGASRGGRVPPTPRTPRLPPQEGFQTAPLKSPLRIPQLPASARRVYSGCRALAQRRKVSAMSPV